MLRELPVKTRPKSKKASYVSYEEYLRIAPESRIMEWVDGEIIEYMPATRRHQHLVTFLGNLIGHFLSVFDLGEVIVAPCEAKLWMGGPSREPDLMFISNENLVNADDKRMYGAPDLAVEIISKSSIRHDRVQKFKEYETAGVREYWLIDPRKHHKQVEFYTLEEVDDKMIFVPADVDDNGRYTSSVLPGLWIDIQWLLADKFPNPVLCAADIVRTHEGLSAEDQAVYEAVYNMHNR